MSGIFEPETQIESGEAKGHKNWVSHLPCVHVLKFNYLPKKTQESPPQKNCTKNNLYNQHFRPCSDIFSTKSSSLPQKTLHVTLHKLAVPAFRTQSAQLQQYPKCRKRRESFNLRHLEARRPKIGHVLNDTNIESGLPSLISVTGPDASAPPDLNPRPADVCKQCSATA